jgi:hypothetical protein
LLASTSPLRRRSLCEEARQLLEGRGDAVGAFVGAWHYEDLGTRELELGAVTVALERAEQGDGRLLEGEDQKGGAVSAQLLGQQLAAMLEFGGGDGVSASGRALHDVGEADACEKSRIVLASGASFSITPTRCRRCQKRRPIDPW